MAFTTVKSHCIRCGQTFRKEVHCNFSICPGCLSLPKGQKILLEFVEL